MTGFIFVTVGNGHKPFTRLLEAVDSLAAEGQLGLPVLIQTGTNAPNISNCQAREFFSADEFSRLISEADVVISHGGAGSLLTIIAAGRVPVVMPRLQQFDEVIDDHQLELARTLAESGLVIPALDARDLPAAIQAARHAKARPRSDTIPNLIDTVRKSVSELIGSPVP